MGPPRRTPERRKDEIEKLASGDGKPVGLSQDDVNSMFD